MTHVIILAAGKGSRMGPGRTKVLESVGGVPMLRRVIAAAAPTCVRPMVVVGHRAAEVMEHIGDGCEYVLQVEQRGTGHAVQAALEAPRSALADEIVVLPGDHPLITPETVARMVRARAETDAAVAFATVQLPDFDGFRASFAGCGRVLRGGDGRVCGIVERRDANEEQAAILELNVSYYCFRADWLRANAAALSNRNAAGELYLTDLVAEAVAQGETVRAVPLDDFREGLGVNTPEQLAAAERC